MLLVLALWLVRSQFFFGWFVRSVCSFSGFADPVLLRCFLVFAFSAVGVFPFVCLSKYLLPDFSTIIISV